MVGVSGHGDVVQPCKGGGRDCSSTVWTRSGEVSDGGDINSNIYQLHFTGYFIFNLQFLSYLKM